MNLNLGAILQTLQTTQSDLVREIGHLRTAQHRLWQDSQEEKKRSRRHQDVLHRILRFLGGVFGATPALLPPESDLGDDWGGGPPRPTSATSPDADNLSELHAKEGGGMDSPSHMGRKKRPRTSHSRSAVESSSPPGANIEELLDSVADTSGSASPPGAQLLRKAMSVGPTTSGSGTLFSPARRGLMIEGPSGWKGEASRSTSTADWPAGQRFTRLGSPSSAGSPGTVDDAGSRTEERPSLPLANSADPKGTMGGGRDSDHEHDQDLERESQYKTEGIDGANGKSPLIPRASVPARRSSKTAAPLLSKDQVASWIGQLLNQPSLGEADDSPSQAQLDEALGSTDAQAQALQQSIAALAQSLHSVDEPHPGGGAENGARAGPGSGRDPVPGDARLPYPPQQPPYKKTNPSLHPSAGSVSTSHSHQLTPRSTSMPSPVVAGGAGGAPPHGADPGSSADEMLLFHQFLEPDAENDVPTPLPARETGDSGIGMEMDTGFGDQSATSGDTTNATKRGPLSPTEVVEPSPDGALGTPTPGPMEPNLDPEMEHGLHPGLHCGLQDMHPGLHPSLHAGIGQSPNPGDLEDPFAFSPFESGAGPER